MDNNRFESLAERYFRGDLKEDEYAVLLQMIAQEKLADEFQKIKEKWESEPSFDHQSVVNWQRLSYRINASNAVKPVFRSGSAKWLRITSFAAILIVGVIVGKLVNWDNFLGSSPEKLLVFETPRGEKSKVILPDKTVVWLNASSRLVYHLNDERERSVDLTGEAMFEVTKDEAHPFVVHVNDYDVKVLGTIFNIMAYSDFERQEVTLLEGRVDVEFPNFKESLVPGESFILKDNKYNIVKGNPNQATCWVDNQFNFNNISVVELMKRLENKYDVDIDLHYRATEESGFTGVFKNEETIWQVLDAIQVYMPLRYERDGLRKIKVWVE